MREQHKENRIRILSLLELLNSLTDEDHPLSTEKLCALLAEQNILCGVRTIWRDISALQAHGADILFTRQRSGGFFMAGRELELPEVRLLVDAVQAAPFITQKKADELTRKLRGLLSRYQSEEVSEQIHVENRVKFGNEEIYYNIDTVGRAISKKKKVSFFYHHSRMQENRIAQDEGRNFVVSPYALIWNSDRYYVAANYEKYDSVSVYRLDRMRHTEMTAQSVRPFSEFGGREAFDAADYAAKTFHLYHGERQTVELRCSLDAAEPLADQFGDKIRVSSAQKESFIVKVDVYAGEGLVEWLLQYGDRITVVSPESLRLQVAERLMQIGKAYGLTETYAR